MRVACFLLVPRSMRKQESKAKTVAALALAAVTGFSGTAGAAPIIEDAIGLRITEQALGFVEREADNRALDYFNPRVSKPDVLCYDEVGIDDFAIDSVIEGAELDFHQTPEGLQIVANIDFIDVYGDLWAQDSDTFDLCPSFSRTIEQLYFSGVVFTADIRPFVDESYQLFVEFNGPSQLTFDDFAVDVDGFPDFLEDLVTSQEFVQDFLAQKINDALAERIPALLADPLYTAVFTGTVQNLDYRIGLSQLAIDPEGLNAFVDIQVDAAAGSTPACVPSFAEPIFEKRGTPGLGEYGNSSMLELAVADAGINEVMWAAWKTGLMCYDPETHPLEPFRHVLEGINPMADDMLYYEIQMAQPPQVVFEDGQMVAKMTGFHMEASVLVPSGERKLLMRVDADMSMGARIEVDKATNRVLFSMDAMDLTFERIESELLFSNSEKAEEDLKAFLQGFVVPRMQDKMQRYEVSNSVFPASDYMVMVDFVDFREGHAVAGASMLRADDPQINHNAPETFVDSDPGLVKRTHATIDVSGEDDDTDVLLYSWRLDGTEWSTWTESGEIPLTALTEGEHVFEVKSRDKWQNEDESPASVTFRVAAETERDMMGGCGCNLTGTAEGSPVSAGAAGALLGAVALGLTLRRRRTHA